MIFSITSISMMSLPTPSSWLTGKTTSPILSYQCHPQTSLRICFYRRVEGLKNSSEMVVSESNEESSDNSNNKKTYDYSTYFIRLPRILKRDIRRSYATMFCNMSNSYNEDMISSFFETFACNDIQLIHHCPTSVVRNLDLRGRDLVSQFHMAYLQTSPDKITRVKDVKIRQTSDTFGKCEIWADFSIEHTSFFRTNPSMVADAMIKEMERKGDSGAVLSNQSETMKRKKKRKYLDLHNSSKSLCSFRIEDHFTRWRDPVSFKVLGSMVFVIDEEKRIEKLICIPKTMGLVTSEGFHPVALDTPMPDQMEL